MQRQHEVDGLRGMAAMVVTLHHCFFQLGSDKLDTGPDWFNFAAHLLTPGMSAVPLFFVMSGYVLSLGVSSSPSSTLADYPGYVARRLFRLLPAMAVAVVFAALMWRYHGGKAGWDDVLAHLTFERSDMDAPLWSIKVEFILCMLVPALAMCMRRCDLLGLAPLFASLVWITWGGDPTWQFALLFALGIAVPRAGPRLLALTGTGALPALVACLGMGLPPLVGTYFWPGHYAGPLLVIAAPSFWLVSWAALTRPAILRCRPVLFLGAISYSLYLVHWPISVAVQRLWHDWIGWYGAGWWSILTEALMCAVMIGLSIALAWAMWRLIEIPSIALGRRIASWRPRRSYAPVTSSAAR